ncbi:MAG: tetratricopeptide repeat protein [Pseudomonadota bacterium]
MPRRTRRRLAAVLAADVAGYSRLMSLDEGGTARRLGEHFAVLQPLAERHRGRVVKTMGDGLLVEFPSAVAAMEYAMAFQRLMARRNARTDPDHAMAFRIGIHLADVLIAGDDILGEGVNLAARLQELARPGGICLSRTAWEQVRGRVDLAFDDLGEQRLKNIPEPVHVFGAALPPSQGEGAPPRSPLPAASPSLPTPLPLPDRPSIVVMPFANLSDEPDQAFFADGITEDLTTALSRLRWLFVIARNSAYASHARGVDLRSVARDLGVRYVLEGSVRRAGKRLRVTGQLVEAETGHHIWGEKYDRQLDDIFALQDEITANIVASIEPHLLEREGGRVASRPPENIDVWGLVVRAIALVNRFGRAENVEARQLLERAISLDPAYSRAHAVLSWALWWATLYYYIPDREAGYLTSHRHAQEAVRLDSNEPWARLTAGLNLSTAGQHERALAELAAALALNPSFALAHAIHGWALVRAGRYEEAITETAAALRMSPLDTFAGLYTTSHGLALLAARRFEEALPHLRASVAADAEFAGHYNTLISCCGHLGLQEEAAEWIARRNRVGPPLRAAVLRRNLRNFAHGDIFVEGLLKAGVPE